MEAASPASNGVLRLALPRHPARSTLRSSHACRATLGYSGHGVQAPMRFLIGFGMVTARTLAGVFLAGAGLAIVCSSLAEIDPLPAAQRWHGTACIRSRHSLGRKRAATRDSLFHPARRDCRLKISSKRQGEFDALEQQRGTPGNLQTSNSAGSHRVRGGRSFGSLAAKAIWHPFR